MSKKQCLLSLILALILTGVLHFYGSDHHTFARKWQDNISNISSAFLFRHEGLEIYRKASAALVSPYVGPQTAFPAYLEPEQLFRHPQSDIPIFLVWSSTPRPYPIGAWLWYAPASYLVYGQGFSIRVATLLSSFMFMLMAHLSFFFFMNLFLKNGRLAQAGLQRGLELFVLFFCYYEFIRWSGQGQYDLLAMVPLLLSIEAFRSRNLLLCLLYYGAALSLHFRSLFLLGMILLALGILARDFFRGRMRLGIRQIGLIAVSAGLGLSAAVIFYWNVSYLADPTLFTNNSYHLSKIGNFSIWKLGYYLLGTWGFVVWFLWRRRWDLGLTLLVLNLILLTTPLMRGWYIMFLFPVFLMANQREDERSDLLALVLAYVMLASTYIGQSPFEFTFIRELWRMI